MNGKIIPNIFTLYSDQNGQTLIEALIALTGAVIVLGALTVAVASSLSNATFLTAQNKAGKYAQQGMEYIRYLRNTDATTFLSYASGNNARCLPEDTGLCPTGIDGTCISGAPGASGPGLCLVNVAGQFKRTVAFLRPSPRCDPTETEVTIDVYWTSGKCTSSNTFCHVSELKSCFNDSQTPLPTL
jgi:hypothetical protein